MTNVRVGTGGWAYFQGHYSDPLSEYARAFDFVEINSTFYDTPQLATVQKWREQVTDEFAFSVRAHRGVLTERDQKKLSLTLEQHARICHILKTRLLVLIPATSGLPESFPEICTFLRANDITPIIDCRSFRPKPDQVRDMVTMQCVQAVDISRQSPEVSSRILYSRLFGIPKGNAYQFSDDELRTIHKKAISSDFEQSVLAFHGVKMYSDAARFKSYHQSGVLPRVTSKLGLQSLREVLSEDMSFPASKADLVRLQGWKLIDSSSNERVRAVTLLEKLPERTYCDIEEVIGTFT